MELTAGDTLAERYELEHELGSGGMGSVWQAHDLLLGRAVAIKAEIAAGAGRGGTRRRLRHEAAVISGLTQPRLARVYDYIEADDTAFIVMELIEGESLAARLKREGRPPLREAVHIAAQSAEALHAAHLAGVVHQDVKPSNIMLTDDGVKIVDFGIAATMRRPGAAWLMDTLPDGLIGTVAYLAPERARGEDGSPAADLYALGVVLYQMLAGRLPFDAGEPPARRALGIAPLPADVPRPLADLCLRLLAEDPAARPASAAEVAARLNGLDPHTDARRGTGRRRRRALMGAPALAVAVAAGAWGAAGIAGHGAEAHHSPQVQVNSGTTSHGTPPPAPHATATLPPAGLTAAGTTPASHAPPSHADHNPPPPAGPPHPDGHGRHPSHHG